MRWSAQLLVAKAMHRVVITTPRLARSRNALFLFLARMRRTSQILIAFAVLLFLLKIMLLVRVMVLLHPSAGMWLFPIQAVDELRMMRQRTLDENQAISRLLEAIQKDVLGATCERDETLSNIQAKIRELTDEKEKAKSEQQSDAAKLKELCASIGGDSAALGSEEDSLKMVRQRINVLQRDSESKQEKLDKISQELLGTSFNDEEDSLVMMCQRVSDMKAKNQTLDNDNAELKKKLVKVARLGKASEAKATELGENIKKVQETMGLSGDVNIEAITQAIESMKSSVSEKEQRIQKLQSDNETIAKALGSETSLESILKSIEAVQTRRADLELGVKRLNEEVLRDEQVHDTFTDVISLVQSLRSAVEQKESEQKQIKAALELDPSNGSPLVDEVKMCRQRLREIQSLVHADDMAATAGAVQAMIEERDSQAKKLEELEKTIASVKCASDDSVQELRQIASKSLTEMMIRLRKIFSITTEEIYEYSDLVSANSDDSKYTKLLQVITVRVHEDAEALAKSKKQFAELKEKVKLVVAQSKKQAQEIEELKKQSAAAAKNMADASTDKDTMLKNLSEITQEKEKLQTELAKAREEAAREKAAYAQEKTKLEELNKDLKQKSEQLQKDHQDLNTKYTELVKQGEELEKVKSDKDETNEKLSAMTKKCQLAARKLQKVAEDEKKIRAVLAKALPPLGAEMAADAPILNWVVKFCEKYPSILVQSAETRFNKHFGTLTQKVSDLASQVLRLIALFEKYKDYHKREKEGHKDLEAISKSYSETLSMLFPPGVKLSPQTDHVQIHNELTKIQELIKSIFLLIPHAAIPENTDLFGYTLALRRNLEAADPITDSISADATDVDLTLTEEQARQGRLFTYEKRIQELAKTLSHSMPYADIVSTLEDILNTEAESENDEEAIVDLFQDVRERLEDAEGIRDKFLQYKKTVEALLQGIGTKVPQNVQPLVELLKNFRV